MFTGRKLNTSHYSVIGGQQSGSRFSTVGVYGFKKISVYTCPVIYCFSHTKGIGYTLLCDSLDAEPFSIVRVKGVVKKNESLYRMNVLCPEEYEITGSAREFVDKAGVEYRQIKAKLERRTKPAGSKLQWPDFPDWQAAYQEDDRKMIVTTGMADLMYAAEITFVLDEKADILKVFSIEEFKGE
ncbi:hypothetical protein JW935_00525 [candidate division KSB1 bacterium]|nr:hypothetical protein [candidate division KSB1 bacterium]